MKICPVCETENKPQATHCEVCGERLDPADAGDAPAAAPVGDDGGFFLREDETAAPTPAPAAPAPEPEPAAPAPTPAAAPATPAASAEAAAAEARKKDQDLEAAFAALQAQMEAEDAGAPAPAPAVAPAATPAPVAATPAPTPAPVAAPAPAPRAPAPQRPAPAPAPKPRIMSSGIPNARLVVYQNKQPAHTHPVVNDETLIGRYDPVSGSYPDLDLTEFDADAKTSRKHAYIYRQNRDYYLYPVSNGGTQLNKTLLDMGQRKKLADGDVIILAASLAMKFHIDE